MSNYILTNQATNDLTEIWNYTYDEYSEAQADKYYFQLISVFESLAFNVHLGKSYSHIREELRGFKMERHIVFYRSIKDNQIEILRILHQSMDQENKPF